MFEPKGYPAKDGDWETFEILGRKALFSNYRIDRDTIPEGLRAYDLRDCDDLSGDPAELKSRVVVNHFGTIVVHEPIDGADDGIELTPDDYNFVGGEMDIGEFAAWKNHGTEEWPDA